MPRTKEITQNVLRKLSSAKLPQKVKIDTIRAEKRRLQNREREKNAKHVPNA